MSKRHPPKSLAGLRSLQKLGTLAVPAVPLEQVPEEAESKSGSKIKPEILRTDNWKSVENATKEIIRRDFSLEEQGKISSLHQNIKEILRSRTGTFLCDCYREWLVKEMENVAVTVRNLKGAELLKKMESIWTSFYKDTIPLLEAVLHLLKTKGRLSVRSSALVAFRDVIFFAGDIEEAMKNEDYLSLEIRHAIMILQNVNDCYPPSKNKLRLEALATRFSSSFLGYYGLYENGQLIVSSNESAIAAKRRPSESGARRLSRPFSVQPQQMETLNQLFKKAIRHKGAKFEGIKKQSRTQLQ